MKRSWLYASLLVWGLGWAESQQPAPSTPADQILYKPGENGIKGPVPLNFVEAETPSEARQKHLSGKCAVSLAVDSKGMPQRVELIRCTDPIFAESSLSAVKKYRFKPAAEVDGTPVQVVIPIVVAFNIYGSGSSARPPVVQVRCDIHTIPGASSSASDVNGVYPLAEGMIPPKLIGFADDGYQMASFEHFGNSPCDLLLTIDATGKATDPREIHCERSELNSVAARSLLDSRFQPASANGNPVPTRAAVHLEFVGFTPAK